MITLKIQEINDDLSVEGETDNVTEFEHNVLQLILKTLEITTGDKSPRGTVTMEQEQ